MIRIFGNARRVLFFPKTWANSVSKWILGVHSSDGSVEVRNTSNPGDNGSVDLKVNLSLVCKKVAERIESMGLTDTQINIVKEVFHGLVDGDTIKWNDNVIYVDSNKIAKTILDNLPKPAGGNEEGEDDDEGDDPDEDLFTGSVIAAYGGYAGNNWDYYLQAMMLTYRNGLLVSVDEVEDIHIV